MTISAENYDDVSTSVCLHLSWLLLSLSLGLSLSPSCSLKPREWQTVVTCHNMCHVTILLDWTRHASAHRTGRMVLGFFLLLWCSFEICSSQESNAAGCLLSYMRWMRKYWRRTCALMKERDSDTLSWLHWSSARFCFSCFFLSSRLWELPPLVHILVHFAFTQQPGLRSCRKPNCDPVKRAEIG